MQLVPFRLVAVSGSSHQCARDTPAQQQTDVACELGFCKVVAVGVPTSNSNAIM